MYSASSLTAYYQGCSKIYCGPNILYNIVLLIVRQKNIVLLFIEKWSI